MQLCEVIDLILLAVHLVLLLIQQAPQYAYLTGGRSLHTTHIDRYTLTGVLYLY